MAAARQGTTFDRSDDALLRAVTTVLVERPDSSLGDIARLVGVGRTTLYRRFPTRLDIVRAVALDAIEQVAGAYGRAGLAEAFTESVGDSESLGSLERLVVELVPLGPRLAFLLRAAELDDDAEIGERVGALDDQLDSVIRRAQERGVIDRDRPSFWVAESLWALAFIAWEQVDRGRLAAADAPRLVIDSWMRGATASP